MNLNRFQNDFGGQFRGPFDDITNFRAQQQQQQGIQWESAENWRINLNERSNFNNATLPNNNYYLSPGPKETLQSNSIIIKSHIYLQHFTLEQGYTGIFPFGKDESSLHQQQYQQPTQVTSNNLCFQILNRFQPTNFIKTDFSKPPPFDQLYQPSSQSKSTGNYPGQWDPYQTNQKKSFFGGDNYYPDISPNVNRFGSPFVEKPDDTKKRFGEVKIGSYLRLNLSI